MQILSVTLKNFKTHRDKHFTFSPGTNAICGENGAGKTSILEAIAWTLFNYQGEYSKDDLIRNGSGSAEVTVDFVSNQDGRTYTVQRHTNKGYTPRCSRSQGRTSSLMRVYGR
ncbi:MAG: SMC family ATPase, partial [Cyanobacteria bacterium J06636_16]